MLCENDYILSKPFIPVRIRIEFGEMADKIIPIDYHYYLFSAVYSWMRMGNEELATRYHYSKDLKPFTFSEIKVGARQIDNLLQIKESLGSLIFSSCFNDVVEAVVKGALMEGELKIKDVSFPITSIEVLEEPEFSKKMVFKTISPIVVSKPVRDKNGRYRHWFLYPNEVEWYVYLEKNIKRRLMLFDGEEYYGSMKIRVLESKKPKRYKIAGGYVRGSKVVFEISAPTKLIKIGYQSGFGERTGQGFGCVEIVKKPSRILRAKD
ncbi:CRISPR-associated endoribonuclease Cas6 [Aciduliprofundum sp. MAR08-339]|uniref:CRISPR-associated endoribonuclease Cas6 n=1 Tax=Aciduliprofundum sp. (strain MAR08-339) TaxID=673860 RepID=UPI0030806F53